MTNTPTPVEPTTTTTTSSARGRWALASIAGAGLLSLGLLGGILIGQQMTPSGSQNLGAQAQALMHQGEPRQHPRAPGDFKERIKDQMKDRMKEMWQEHLNHREAPAPVPVPSNG